MRHEISALSIVSLSRPLERLERLVVLYVCLCVFILAERVIEEEMDLGVIMH